MMMQDTQAGGYANSVQQTQPSLTETLNDSAEMANTILKELSAAHERLFGPRPPVPVANTTPGQPNAFSMARLTLGTLHDISAMLGLHHQRI